MKRKDAHTAPVGPGTTAGSGAGKEKAVRLEGLSDLFIDELKDIFGANNALIKALPKMITDLTPDELEERLTIHLEATKEHIARVEEVFSIIGGNRVAKRFEPIAGLNLQATHYMDT